MYNAPPNHQEQVEKIWSEFLFLLLVACAQWFSVCVCVYYMWWAHTYTHTQEEHRHKTCLRRTHIWKLLFTAAPLWLYQFTVLANNLHDRLSHISVRFQWFALHMHTPYVIWWALFNQCYWIQFEEVWSVFLPFRLIDSKVSNLNSYISRILPKRQNEQYSIGQQAFMSRQGKVISNHLYQSFRSNFIISAKYLHSKTQFKILTTKWFRKLC